jgi:hypothetical protein
MEVTGQLHAPTAFPTGKVIKKNPLDGRIGGPQSRYGYDIGKEGFLNPFANQHTALRRTA